MITVALFTATDDRTHSVSVVTLHAVSEGVITAVLVTLRRRHKVNFIFNVTSVMHEEKRTHGLPVHTYAAFLMLTEHQSRPDWQVKEISYSNSDIYDDHPCLTMQN